MGHRKRQAMGLLLQQGMSYWVRLPTSGPLGSASTSPAAHETIDESAKQQLPLTRPIVFLHGVGLGLVSTLFCKSVVPLLRACPDLMCPALQCFHGTQAFTQEKALPPSASALLWLLPSAPALTLAVFVTNSSFSCMRCCYAFLSSKPPWS